MIAFTDFKSMAACLPDPFRLLVRAEASSTNDELRALAVAGAPEGLILLAENQTAGRGRRGTAWFSPAGESLAFSILLRPSAPKAWWPRLALATGLAVAEALESFGLAAGIKWPNDLWCNHRKVAGILVESGGDFVIIGIGLNVNTVDFPPEVAELATSMHLASGHPFVLADVLGAIIQRFSIRRSQIGSEFSTLLDAVRLRCVLTHQRISLVTPDGLKSGWMEGISPAGELILRTQNGIEHFMQADEIRLIPQ